MAVTRRTAIWTALIAINVLALGLVAGVPGAVMAGGPGNAPTDGGPADAAPGAAGSSGPPSWVDAPRGPPINVPPVNVPPQDPPPVDTSSDPPEKR